MNLTYENIHVRLGGKEILKGVHLTAPEGKLTGIIGPNGCGKSTLVKTAFGVSPLSAGRVLFGNIDAASLPPRVRASLVGYVGQESSDTFDFSVEEVAAMGLYARSQRFPAAFRSLSSTKASDPNHFSGPDAVKAALKELGIFHLKDRSILSLSGGEKKLVFIARALVQSGDTLILDEPTNHLDIRYQLFLLDYLKRCGRTVLIVLHDLRLAAHYCDLLYLLSDGQLICKGSPQEVLIEENIRQVFGIRGHACQTETGEMDFSIFN